MKKIRTGFLFIFFFQSCFNGSAQEPLDTAFERTVFWQVTGNGAIDTSYLLGTAHPILKKDIRIASNVLQALIRSNAVYFENIPSDNDDSLFEALNLMEKPRLKQLLGGICYDLLLQRLKEYDDTLINDPKFDWRKPRYFNARIMNNYLGEAPTSIDATLTAIALGNGQRIYALDSKKTNDELMNIQSLGDQATSLYYMLSYKDEVLAAAAKRMNDFTRLYYQGNIGAIFLKSYNLLVSDRFGSYRTFRSISSEKLLDERNKKWISIMASAIQQQSNFFAVGAAHLAGKKGLINQLRRKGFVVSPIFPVY